MKILKTVLLSTTLMMGALSAAEQSAPLEANEDATTRAHAQYLEVFSKFQKFQSEVNATLIRILTRDAMGREHNEIELPNQEEGENLKLTVDSEMIDILRHLSLTIKGLVVRNDGLVAERDDLKAQLTAQTAANERLAEEKARAEEALKSLRSELAQGKEALRSKDEELKEAMACVVRLEEELKGAQASAREAGATAQADIEQLRRNLDAANKKAEALTAEVERLTTANKELTTSATTAEATAQRINSKVVLTAEQKAELKNLRKNDSNSDDSRVEYDPLLHTDQLARKSSEDLVATDDDKASNTSRSSSGSGDAPDAEDAARQQRIDELQAAIVKLGKRTWKGPVPDASKHCDYEKLKKYNEIQANGKKYNDAVNELARYGIIVSTDAAPASSSPSGKRRGK